MLGLANEKLMKDALNNLGLQISALAKLEMEDMKNITQNFMDLKNKVEQKNPEIEKIKEILLDFEKAISFLNRELNTLQKEIKQKEYKEANTKEEIEELNENPFKEKKNIKHKEENLIEYCCTCEEEMTIENPKSEILDNGEKIISGKCSKCGRTLYKII